MIATDNGTQTAAWSEEDAKINEMNEEKISNDLKYPLIKIKDTDINTDTGTDVKILVLGDSFVWPYGSSNMNYLWWNQLSNELKRKGYNCTVYSVGRPGASTHDQLLWLKSTTMMADIKPDIVLIGYVQNDTELSAEGIQDEKHYGLLSTALNNPIINFISKLFPGVFSMFDIKLSVILGPTELFSKKIGYQNFTFELRTINEERLPIYNSYSVAPLGEFAESAGVPFILVTTPQSPDITYFEPRYAPVLPLFEQAGINVYNLLYDFKKECSEEAYQNNYHINPADDHPGTATTWFYAKYIAGRLETDYPDLLGKKKIPESMNYNIEINDWLPYSLNPQRIKSSSNTAEYIVSYPAKNDSTQFLSLPIKKNYVKLNFKYPVDLSAVTIEGEKLDSIALYATGVNDELGFDDQTVFSLGNRSGRVCEWTDDNPLRVTSICVSADISGGAADTLTIKINSEEGGVHP